MTRLESKDPFTRLTDAPDPLGALPKLDIRFPAPETARTLGIGQPVGIRGGNLVVLTNGSVTKTDALMEFDDVSCETLRAIRMKKKRTIGCGILSLLLFLACVYLTFVLAAVGAVAGISIIGCVVGIAGIYTSFIVKRWHIVFDLGHSSLVFDTEYDGKEYVAGLVAKLIDWGGENGVDVSELEEWLG